MCGPQSAHKAADEAEVGHEGQHLPRWTGLFWGPVMVTLLRGQFPPANTPAGRGAAPGSSSAVLCPDHGAAFPPPCPRGHPRAPPGTAQPGVAVRFCPSVVRAKGGSTSGLGQKTLRSGKERPVAMATLTLKLGL